MRHELLLLSISLIFLSLVLFSKGTNVDKIFTPDSYNYFSTAQTIAGQNETSFYKPYRPIYPLVSSIFLGFKNTPLSMLVLPLMCGVISVFLFYELIKTVLGKRNAFVAAIIFSFSNVLVSHATLALTDVIGLCTGLFAVNLWYKKSSTFKISAAFLFAFLSNESTILFYLAAIFSDKFSNQKINWAKPIALIIAILSPAFAYRYWLGWVVYSNAGHIIQSSFTERLAAFFVTLFNASGELLLFSAIQIKRLLFSKKKERLSLFFAFSIFFNSIMQASWSVIYTRLWLTSIPALVFFSVSLFSSMGFFALLSLATYLLFFSIPYSFIAKILKNFV